MSATVFEVIMKNGVFLFVLGVLTFFGTVLLAPTDLETVWLKDMTSSFQTDKRTISDLDLPDDLTFHLSRGSHAVNLNLKRNHGIDPNADVYVVRRLKDGRSIPEKTRNLEKEAVAYYQDRKNGAFMTVRCVRRSNGQCDRVINGNIRIGGRNYDLRLADTDVTSRNLLNVPDLLGKRYVLRDQTNIQREISVENKDAAKVNEKNLEEKLIDLLRRFPQEQDGGNHFPHKHSASSSRNVAGLHNRDKKDNDKQVYWVEIAVLTDSTIWDLYSSLTRRPNATKVETKIQEAYSHVINGVNLLYNKIEDTDIEIKITLRAICIFQTIHDFTHRDSLVQKNYGKDYINAYKYLDDIEYWDKTFGYKYEEYDHAMLFTRYDLFDNDNNNEIAGLSSVGKVCDKGKKTSVVEVGDYFETVTVAAHELGHNLGAYHDGSWNASACRASDLFIMTPILPKFIQGEPYSSKPWIFSNCSVDLFKATLVNKNCVTNEGVVFDMQLWVKYTKKLPGEKYTPNMQCDRINGIRSVFCGDVSADICLFMKCSDPKTGRCMSKHFSADRGTKCGKNMWCKEGRCVSKAPKYVQTAVCHAQPSMKSEKLQDFLVGRTI